MEEFMIASVDKNLRLCVIENCIFIEELTSRVLGNILNIEWEKSKSFGHTSSALSFNQKLQLIQDIKGIDKEDVKKVICISNIRNKFAHVSDIDSFKKLFSNSPIGKEIQIQFLKWYFDENGLSDIHPSKTEFVYRLCFYLLVDSVIKILLKISDEHLYKKGFQQGREEFIDKFLWTLINSLRSKNLFFVVEEVLEETTIQ